jgi:sugar lactone lactonase YvrE
MAAGKPFGDTAVITLTCQPFADGFRFLEAPKWRDGNLWVSDVFDLKVISLSPDGSEHIVTLDVPHRPAGLGFLPDGSLVIVSQADQKLLKWDGESLSVYADLKGHAVGYVNDFAVDRNGAVYVGDFGYDLIGGEASKPTSLHRVDPNGTITRAASGLEFPNGSAIVNDGRTLVVAETWVGRVAAFDLSDDGTLSNPRVFANLGERQPDGLCADTQGAIWVACYNTGEFLRIVDGGEITHRVRCEGHAISCTLGGSDRRTLFMTAFLGTEADMAAGRRNGVVLTARVDTPGPA